MVKWYDVYCLMVKWKSDMNNKAFIAELADKCGYTQEDTQKMANTIVDAMTDCFLQGNMLSIPSFGSFAVKKRLERIVINPGTKQKMLIPPKLVLGFRPIASLKERLKNGGTANG